VAHVALKKLLGFSGNLDNAILDSVTFHARWQPWRQNTWQM